MSVRGEYRRMLGELLEALGEAGVASGESARRLEPLAERAGDDLAGAAEETLQLLEGLDPVPPADPASRQRFDDAHERLSAVCRIILGR